MTEDHLPTARGVARIQALMDAAANLFLDQGYEAVSLDTLIAKAGGSRRNIYEHFGGKQGLFVDVITRLCNEQAAPLRQLDVGSGEIGPALVMFGERLLEVVLQPRTLALQRLMIAEGQRFPELAQAILRSGHDTGVEILADWLRPRLPELRGNLPPEKLAEQFIGLVVTGPQLRALVGAISLPLPAGEVSRLAHDAVSTFLHGTQPAIRSPHA
ncbi:TetR/AcrR family transcriptional regulator [Agrobacterium tumefaciens]|uniref:TetR/AcrR family transcriptional regulator n=1 Tax=Agrobacterium TaxID=357 RepID=UPI00157187DA|nr:MULTISPECIES: TetR/AcrR family transcriptional regulator [Agrobacterium]MBO0128878.1 TetR/AcrR family transcriptional regulator [Agrobacterium sp. OT33]NTE58986.1 TetR/AcrR family transcriptional regulator [Agrobacterium tumefaciens]NTE72584.1 TetR/AcrR family transcriptional regulator [Agrobacterium tumefaciens]UXT51339.1 TetR/AcrR family transcriptional regulator [Agrobacterium tumefaciens]